MKRTKKPSVVATNGIDNKVFLSFEVFDVLIVDSLVVVGKVVEIPDEEEIVVLDVGRVVKPVVGIA